MAIINTDMAGEPAAAKRIGPVAVVVNPISGSAAGRTILTGLLRRMRRAGIRTLLHRTTGPGDAGRFLGRAGSSCQTVIAVGGDGTAREVAEALVSDPKCILIVPTGTENIVAKELGFVPDVDLLWRALVDQRRRQVDLGLLNDRVFVIMGGVGFDAEVVARLVRQRQGHISHLSYFWPIWRTFWEHRFERLRVTADGELLCDEPALVFVGNLARYAMGLRILREARDDDGLLDLCIYRCGGQGKLLLHAWNTILGRHVHHGAVVYRKCKEIEVSSAATVPVQADGDPAGQLPARFRVLPRAAMVLVPPRPIA